MAREFLAASSESVADTSIATPLTGVRRTIAMTVKLLSVGAAGRYLGVVVDDDNASLFFGFMISNTDLIRYRTAGVTTNVSVNGPTAMANRWYRLVGMSLSATDHRLYVDGRLVATSATDIGTFDTTALNRIMIGGESWVGEYCDAHIAEVAVWDGDLSAHDVWRYGQGYPASSICPQLLRIYVPFAGDDLDRRGGNNLSTVTGTPTWAPHPPMRQDAQRAVRKPAAAAGANPKGVFGLALDGPLRRVVYS